MSPLTTSSMQLLIALLALFLHPALSLIIMVPLYAYPGDHTTSAWTSLTQTIATHPEVSYLIIINPSSGPGSDTYPDSNSIAAIAQLNSFPNVNLIGYIDTRDTSTALQTIFSNIDKYANWASYEQSDIALRGIFFDDMSSSDNATVYEYMTAASNYAYSAFAESSSGPTVVLNPGRKVGAKYFRLADYVIEFEDSLARYKGLASVKRKKLRMRKKQAIVAHSTTVGQGKLEKMVTEMYKRRMGAVYLTKEGGYDGMSPDQLANISGIVDRLQNGR
ncbi:hypothetical protein MBLNU457_1665t1 [Dothideomycetes sp. NU457]